MWRVALLCSWVSAAALCGVSLADPDATDKKLTIVDADQAGDAFALQGEYAGTVYTPHTGRQQTGLQLIAQGGGQFAAVQYQSGLPGAGWNRSDKFGLAGGQTDRRAELEVFGYRAEIVDGKASLFNCAGQLLGHLVKTHRSSPTIGAPPPPKAVVLFDGSSVEAFGSGTINPDGSLLTGVTTQQMFGDFYLHVEFRTPYMPNARGQARGNSGVYIQERYEVQILDSFGLEGVENECGGLYKTQRPDVNMCLPPLTWQTYDIFFKQPRWDEQGNKSANARLTVFHNGVAIHSDFEVPHKTGAGRPEAPDPRPIRFQWHGNPVYLRNIWIVPDAWRPPAGATLWPAVEAPQVPCVPLHVRPPCDFWQW